MIFWFLFEILLILEKGVDILDVNNLFIFIVANNLSESYLYIKWEFNQTIVVYSFYEVWTSCARQPGIHTAG